MKFTERSSLIKSRKFSSEAVDYDGENSCPVPPLVGLKMLLALINDPKPL